MNGYDIETVVTRLDDRVSPRTETGDVVAPIHLTTTHEMHSPGEADHDYKCTRFGNPTRDVLENRLARIRLFLGNDSDGDNVPLTARERRSRRSIRGNLRRDTAPLEDLLSDSLGVSVEYVDATEMDAVAAAVTDETALVWMESPDEPAVATVRPAGDRRRRGGGRRNLRRRQYLLDAVSPAAARGRRRRRSPQHDEVPERT